MLLGERWIVESGAGGESGLAMRGGPQGQIGLDQIEGVLLPVLALDVDDGAQGPCQLRLPHQGGVGQGELTLGPSWARAAITGAAETAVEV